MLNLNWMSMPDGTLSAHTDDAAFTLSANHETFACNLTHMDGRGVGWTAEEAYANAYANAAQVRSRKNASGILRLVCISCLRIVGVINVTEYHRMLDANESYICQDCLAAEDQQQVEDRIAENDPAGMGWTLWMQRAQHYPEAFEHKTDNSELPVVQLLRCPDTVSIT